MLPNLSALLNMWGTILTTYKCLTYSQQDSPMHSIKRYMSLTTHRIMCSGSITPWSDSANGSTSKPALTCLDPLHLVPIGALVLPPPPDTSKAAILTPWTPLLDMFTLDLLLLLLITLCVVYQHQGAKDKAMALMLGK